MKTKTLTHFLVGVFLIAGTAVFGQVSASSFIPGTSHPVTVMTQQNGIKVSYMQGSMGKTAAFSLKFTNTTTHLVTFSWTLKDNSGKAVYTSTPIQIMAGQMLDKDNHLTADNTEFSFSLEKGMNVKGYSIEIK